MTPTTRHTAYQNPSRFQSPYPSDRDREDLIIEHLPKVKYLADRMAVKLPSSVDREDLYGAGIMGLIDAVERFDVSRGVAFNTFAEMRIRGAILDSLRALDWASRSARQRAKKLQNAFAEVEQKFGRAATEEEIAAHLKISHAELQENLHEMRGLKVTEIDRLDEETGLSALDTLIDGSASPLDQYEEQDCRARLAEAVDKLPLRERQVVALYYLEELTMKEIGAVLGVTESRVSQLRTQAIIRLRNRLNTQQ
ncbi:MAG: FliA/WhiG family RNA polymerase sigma factor [Pyrinomonadaceae bacterium]